MTVKVVIYRPNDKVTVLRPEENEVKVLDDPPRLEVFTNRGGGRRRKTVTTLPFLIERDE